MKKTGGVLVPPDDQNKALNEVKTITKAAELREDRILMIRPDINIEDAISASLVYLDSFSRLLDRCYLIWTKANYFIY